MSEVSYGYTTIAEMPKQIILSKLEKKYRVSESYQSEAELEKIMIQMLVDQGYERLSSGTDLYKNLQVQIERLNNVKFSKEEWSRFLLEYLDSPKDGIIEKTRKIQDNHIYDFTFDDGHLQNIKIIDKKDITNNHLQVINQVEQVGKHHNRYDVSILVNGLPLVHIELKRRGVDLQEAFNQIVRYRKESFNEEGSLYKYVQIFIISNGTRTKYFANTTAQNKNHFQFTCDWADVKNRTINDLEEFTETFFEKNTILQILTRYCVFDSKDTLLIMRPYQIAATERILWRINSSYENKRYGTREAGGFVWHTTGSGKTLTSFKTARLATELPFINKVLFVVDRKDLDSQTKEEYENFQQGSVNGSVNIKKLKENLEKDDDRIVITTIQKLNEFVKNNRYHPIYDKQCVLIFDECHRSQFGEAQKNIRRAFKKYYQFGFTGTPIFEDNSLGNLTTQDVFGSKLHSYVITDAIRDGKVLKFKVDYNNVSPKFRDAEIELDSEKIKSLEKAMFLHPERISKITKHILEVFDAKTHKNENYEVKERRLSGFNAMFAVQSVEAAKLYYEEFQKQQKDLPEEKKLKIATIYSFAPNEEIKIDGEIPEEDFEPSAMNSTAKEFLEKVIDDYNRMFKTNYSIDGPKFQNYYENLSKRVRDKEVDILIVVGMFLTGFDAPTMNTLFVDKNLKYHGLIQAFSRTNRILNKIKAFGNIVCFRDLEKNTKDAIKLFGDEKSVNIILEKAYIEHIDGYRDEETGEVIEGYRDLCIEMITKFPEPTQIEGEAKEKEFVELFNKILRKENILKNFDEFKNFEKIISDRLKQDMKSEYINIRNKWKNEREKGTQLSFDSIYFEVELMKSEEINLDFILGLIVEKAKEKSTEELKEEILRVIRADLEMRDKEELIMEFMNRTKLEKFNNKADIVAAFYEYAKVEKEKSIDRLIKEENLKEESRRFIRKSIEKAKVEKGGNKINSFLPAGSRRAGRENMKEGIIQKITKLVNVFKNI